MIYGFRFHLSDASVPLTTSSLEAGTGPTIDAASSPSPSSSFTSGAPNSPSKRIKPATSISSSAPASSLSSPHPPPKGKTVQEALPYNKLSIDVHLFLRQDGSFVYTFKEQNDTIASTLLSSEERAAW